ncbi:hypothetical protein ACFL0P_07720 [Candidatus Omnitrophota bacterium]
MRKLMTLVLVLAFVMVSIPVFAAEGSRKGASAKAYEHASDEAVFNRVGDWFSTVGKSKEEKEAIIAERKAKRAAKRAEKEAKKAKKKAEKEAKKAKKEVEKLHKRGSGKKSRSD